MRQVVTTSLAPAAIGPYSQAIGLTGPQRWLFASGQIALTPGGEKLTGEPVETQARQALTNLKAVLEQGGFGLCDVVKTTIFLIDMGDFPAVNGIYQQFFASEPPARATVAVAALPLGARVEIEAVCAK